MSEIKIRRATLIDLEQLLVFEQGVIKAERPFDSTVKADPVNYYDMQTLLTSPNTEVLVAEIDNKIIASGYARIEKSKPFLKHTYHAYLGFMFVLPEYRGQGINRKIMDGLKHWVASQNISEFRLEVYLDNVSAIRSYEKFGFKGLMMEMRFNSDDEKK